MVIDTHANTIEILESKQVNQLPPAPELTTADINAVNPNIEIMRQSFVALRYLVFARKYLFLPTHLTTRKSLNISFILPFNELG